MDVFVNGAWWPMTGKMMAIVADMRKDKCNFEHRDDLVSSWLLRLALAGF